MIYDSSSPQGYSSSSRVMGEKVRFYWCKENPFFRLLANTAHAHNWHIQKKRNPKNECGSHCALCQAVFDPNLQKKTLPSTRTLGALHGPSPPCNMVSFTISGRARAKRGQRYRGIILNLIANGQRSALKCTTSNATLKGLFVKGGMLQTRFAP